MAITKATASSVAPAAKGDLVAGSATNDAAVLTVGANDTVLTADSSTATGLKWAAPAASGGMTLISETIASSLTGLSFSSLGSYKQLLLMWAGIEHSNSSTCFTIRFNNSSSSVYQNSVAYLTGSTIKSYVFNDNGLFGSADYSPFGKNAGGTNAYEGAVGTLLIDNYTSATADKTYSGQWGYWDNSAAVTRFSPMTVGYFDSTTAITTLDIVRTVGAGTFSNKSGTTIRLYGIS